MKKLGDDLARNAESFTRRVSSLGESVQVPDGRMF